MNRFNKLIFFSVFSLVAGLALASSSNKQMVFQNLPLLSNGKSPVVIHPNQYQWKKLPSGIEYAIVKGNPKTGPVMMLVKYPPHSIRPPHYHPQNAYFLLISGTQYIGFGNTFNKKKAIKFTPGALMVARPKDVHYEWTNTGSMALIYTDGPFKSIEVNKKGQPINK